MRLHKGAAHGTLMGVQAALECAAVSHLVHPPRLLWSALALVALVGCAADPAPEAITDVTRWLWRNYDTASDERMAQAIVALNGVVTPVTADEPMKVVVSKLTAGDVALSGRKDGDAAKAVGLLVITEFACKLSQIEKIHTAPDQDVLHPDSYTAYKRTYVGSRDDFLAQKVHKLGWDTELTSKYATESLAGSARRIPDQGKAASPFGAALISRTWLKAPATGMTWPQDYQIEAYYERAPGRIIHMMAAWREMSYGPLTMESTSLQNVQMGGFVDWDKAVEKQCASGKF